MYIYLFLLYLYIVVVYTNFSIYDSCTRWAEPYSSLINQQYDHHSPLSPFPLRATHILRMSSTPQSSFMMSMGIRKNNYPALYLNWYNTKNISHQFTCGV